VFVKGLTALMSLLLILQARFCFIFYYFFILCYCFIFYYLHHKQAQKAFILYVEFDWYMHLVFSMARVMMEVLLFVSDE